MRDRTEDHVAGRRVGDMRALCRLPPALIISAEHDTLRDEAAAYARRLTAAGVPARYLCVQGMVHGFLQMGGLVEQAQTEIEEIARTLR